MKGLVHCYSLRQLSCSTTISSCARNNVTLQPIIVLTLTHTIKKVLNLGPETLNVLQFFEMIQMKASSGDCNVVMVS